MLARMSIAPNYLAVLAMITCAGLVEQLSAQAAATQAPIRASVDFPGGTLDQYVRAVRAQVPSASIVIDGLETVNVPRAALSNVSLSQALQWVTTTADARQRGLILQPTRLAGDPAEVFVFTRAQAALPAPQPTVELVSKDYPVDSIPGRPNWGDELQSAVAGRLSAVRNPPTGRVEYISWPPVLRVTGTVADIRDADQTVDVLTRAQATVAVLPQLQAEVGRLRTQVDTLRLQVAELERRLAETAETQR